MAQLDYSRLYDYIIVEVAQELLLWLGEDSILLLRTIPIHNS